VRTLSRQEARRVYDRIGSLQDSQAFYEDVASRELVLHGDFPSAQWVFEFGCGTGRFARTLLREQLVATAKYRAVDLSPRMVEIATARLSEFGERVEVVLSDGGPPASEPAAAFDRFVSTYVFDLLSEADIAAVIAEAHRMLRPGGLLCISSLGTGHGAISRALARAWSAVHRLKPQLVGGCRPIQLLPYLAETRWTIRHHHAVAPFAIPSEVVVAERR
jgi:SAM-dependent methyltransferase